MEHSCFAHPFQSHFCLGCSHSPPWPHQPHPTHCGTPLSRPRPRNHPSPRSVASGSSQELLPGLSEESTTCSRRGPSLLKLRQSVQVLRSGLGSSRRGRARQGEGWRGVECRGSGERLGVRSCRPYPPTVSRFLDCILYVFLLLFSDTPYLLEGFEEVTRQ